MTYLANALAAAPAASPVTVQVSTEDQIVRVAVQQELYLSLGLGLYLCRALIEHQRGRVGVQSAPGQGATFWFTLPLAR